MNNYNQNYQIQNKDAVNPLAMGSSKSFIQIKDVGDVGRDRSKTLVPTDTADLFSSPLAVAQALNQGVMVDSNTINSSLQKANFDLSQQMLLVQVLDAARKEALQREMTRLASTPSSSMMMPKGNNIFAPKPMHAKVEMGRIGRSRSMYVTNNPLKTDGSSGEKSIISEKPSEEGSQADGTKNAGESATNRKRMNVFRCPHTDRKHYAKNMCNNCYHKLGRNKKATACPHTDRQNYAKGKCQNCYLNDYHKNKRKQKKQKALQEQKEKARTISVETSASEVTKSKKVSISAGKQE